MLTYVLSLYLNEGYDQSEIMAAILDLGDTRQALPYTWFLKSDMSPKEIRDTLSLHLAPDERLMVMKAGGPAAWRNLMCDNKWIIDNLTSK